jgi:hypothetical protein
MPPSFPASHVHHLYLTSFQFPLPPFPIPHSPPSAHSANLQTRKTPETQTNRTLCISLVTHNHKPTGISRQPSFHSTTAQPGHRVGSTSCPAAPAAHPRYPRPWWLSRQDISEARACASLIHPSEAPPPLRMHFKQLRCSRNPRNGTKRRCAPFRDCGTVWFGVYFRGRVRWSLPYGRWSR